jgi:hypothetical protein
MVLIINNWSGNLHSPCEGVSWPEIWCIRCQLSSQGVIGCSGGIWTLQNPQFQENILALHQPLNEQADFTQGNNRAKVRVVANYPP